MQNSQDRKDKTRQRILKSAAHLFNRNGLTETTIDEIMTAAGLTHGGFYRHFASKDELYAEAVRRFCARKRPSLGKKVPAMRAEQTSLSQGLS